MKLQAVEEHANSEEFAEELAKYWELCYYQVIEDVNECFPDRPLDPKSFDPLAAFDTALARLQELDEKEATDAANEALNEEPPSDTAETPKPNV